MYRTSQVLLHVHKCAQKAGQNEMLLNIKYGYVRVIKLGFFWFTFLYFLNFL